MSKYNIEVINPEPEPEAPADENVEDVAIEQQPEEQEEQPEQEAVAQPAEEEFSVQIGDDQPEQEEQRAPDWVRDLRKQHRELARRNRELEEQLRSTSQPAATAIGAKPTLEGCDYDAEKYERELATWFERKRNQDAEAARIQQEQEAAQKSWQQKLASYTAAKSELKVKDFEDAEALVQEQFNVTQQGILLQGLENAALVVYALGKNPKKAKELAGITDPVRFAVAAGKLESQLKITNRKPPPAPPKAITSSGPVSGTVDSTLERLRAEAEKTGNYSKVFAYRKQLRQKA